MHKIEKNGTLLLQRKGKRFLDMDKIFDNADISEQSINVSGHKGSKDLSLNGNTAVAAAASAGKEDRVQMQILRELQRVNARLAAVEDQVAGTSKGPGKQHRGVYELSRSSRPNSYKPVVSNSCNSRYNDLSESDSDAERATNVPSLSALRDSIKN